MAIWDKRAERIGGLLGSRIKHARDVAARKGEEHRGLDGFNFVAPRTAAKADGMISRKAAEGLAERFGGEEQPFEACMVALAEQYPDEHVRAQVCGAVKAATKRDLRSDQHTPLPPKPMAVGPSAGPTPTAKQDGPSKYQAALALARAKQAGR